MQIDNHDIKKVAQLARIELSVDKEYEMQQSLNGIFNWINQLKSIDTSAVEPLFNVTLEQMPLREDVVNDGHCVNEILKNAPESAYNMFAVPKFIE